MYIGTIHNYEEYNSARWFTQLRHRQSKKSILHCMYAINYDSLLCELFWCNLTFNGTLWVTSAPCAVMIYTQSVGSAPAEKVEQIVKYMQDQSIHGCMLQCNIKFGSRMALVGPMNLEYRYMLFSPCDGGTEASLRLI